MTWKSHDDGAVVRGGIVGVTINYRVTTINRGDAKSAEAAIA